MRFIVLVDLISTFVAPVTCVYLGYLIYILITEGGTIPMTALIMLAAYVIIFLIAVQWLNAMACRIYGMQAIVFILRGAFEMVGWLVIYICAIPLFSFILPLYSFWRMVGLLIQRVVLLKLMINSGRLLLGQHACYSGRAWQAPDCARRGQVRS